MARSATDSSVDWKKSKYFGKIIDVWAQPYIPEIFDKLPEVLPLFKKSKSPAVVWQRNHQATFTSSELVTQLDQAGIQHVLMSAWKRPNDTSISNDLVIGYGTEQPDRISALIAVDLFGDIQKECEKIDQLCQKYPTQIKGIRILPWLWEVPPTDRRFYPIFLKCIENDLVFCTQVGHTGPLKPSEVGRPIPYIDQLALDWPRLKIVGGHTGHPWLQEMLSCVWKHENVYIDTSAYLPQYYPRDLIAAMNTGLYRNKVMFATNYPQLSWDNCTRNAIQVLTPKLKPQTMEAFLYGNAQRVFKIGDQSGSDNFESRGVSSLSKL